MTSAGDVKGGVTIANDVPGDNCLVSSSELCLYFGGGYSCFCRKKTP